LRGNIHIISPHIDDAILSLGGFISSFKNSGNIVIKYIFSISDWTNARAIGGKVYKKNAQSVTLLRKNEEMKASELLNYRYEYLDLLDFPLRRNVTDSETVETIRKNLTGSIGKDEICFFPLGLSHPDHVLIREIGFALKEEGYLVLFYEDLPYVFSADSSVQNLVESKQLESASIMIEMESKLEAIKVYRSQIPHEWIRDVIYHSYDAPSNSYKERFWKPIGQHLDFYKK
jgi:LmbE family N-acetylglucosaminyl deacetylase